MSVVDDVKQRIDIVDLVSQHVALKRAGRSFMACCPFHQEKTPSFHVDPARQTWHCFGACGTGGDIFSFIMKKDGIEFRDALRVLAEQAGVSTEQRRDPQEDARRGRLFEVNEAAAAYFHAGLQLHEGPYAHSADAARAYIEERRLAASSVEAFQLGYAPNSWDALSLHLESRGFTAEDARNAGLAIEGERGVYDRFRHRLMFPIRDDRGRVSGFGGRVLPGEAVGGGNGPQPKYVNTSQSAIFDKGAILYGLDLGKDAIRSEGRAVIVEGYMDTIAAHEHGFANVVASMGTALTERQVALLKRYTRNLILALDADAAGSEATLRGVRVVADNVDHEVVPVTNWRGVIRMQETLAADIRVLTMPTGRDPDEVIRNDSSLWPELVDASKPVLDYLFEAVTSRHDLHEPRERSVVSSELLPMVAAVSDRVVQSHYLQQLARITRVDEQTLRLEMRRPPKAVPPQRNLTDEGGQAPTPVRQDSVRDKREEFCLAILFRYPELLSEGQEIAPDTFGRSENRALFDAWVGSQQGEALEEALTADLRPQYERILNMDLPAYDDDAAVEALRSILWGIEQQRLRNAKRASSAVFADMATDDPATVAERARETWQTGIARVGLDEEGDPATAFVDDMEAGLRIHERLLSKRRGTGSQ